MSAVDSKLVQCKGNAPWCEVMVSSERICTACHSPMCAMHTGSLKPLCCRACSQMCDICGECVPRSRLTEVEECPVERGFSDKRYRCIACAKEMVRKLTEALAKL